MSTKDFGDDIWKCLFCHQTFTNQEWWEQVPKWLKLGHGGQTGLYHPHCVQPAKVAARLGT